MDITIPKNIRQIGELEESRKIYVEDYVVTYLRQYAKEKIEDSCAAILLGYTGEQDGISYIFIRSALEIGTEIEDGNKLSFSDSLWMGIYEEIDRCFPGQEILGWFISMPGFPLEITYEIYNCHRNNFPGQAQLLFLADPTEGEEAFFAAHEGNLIKQNGYFIFYEKNEPMQEYMMEKRGGKSVDAEAGYSDQAARSFRVMVQEKKDRANQKRIMAFLYGASTFLVLVVLIIGITMINNYEKMERVEMALNDLTQNLETQQVIQQMVLPEEPRQETKEDEEPEISEEVPGEGFPEQEALENEGLQETGAEVDAKAEDVRSGSYVVQPGDTLLAISRKIYGSDRYIEAICELNKIEDRDRILIGEKILLP